MRYLGLLALLITGCGYRGAVTSADPTTTTRPVILEVEVAAEVYIQPVRIDPPEPPTTTAPIPTGLHGLPFAPEGLDECEEMLFYMRQAGLPERFGDGGKHQAWTRTDGLGWRESKCKNYVNTYCCYGYWQLYISLFLKDWQLGPTLRNECEVFGVSDIFGEDPLQKQKQACAAKALYDLQGLSPWSPH